MSLTRKMGKITVLTAKGLKEIKALNSVSAIKTATINC